MPSVPPTKPSLASSQPCVASAAVSEGSEQSRVTSCLGSPPFSQMPRWLQAELRSDHAGEYGAVMIYRGILAISRDESARAFAERHIATERDHLRLMEEAVPPAARTHITPLVADGVAHRGTTGNFWQALRSSPPSKLWKLL